MLATDLAVWAYNYKIKIGNFASSLGMTPEEVATEIAICNKIIDAINGVFAAKATLKSTVKTRNSIIATEGFDLRKVIKRHKSSAGYTDAIGFALGIIGSDSEFNPSTYQPVIKVEPFGKLITIRFAKKGVDSINIYQRKKGDDSFRLLARATKSPFKYQPTMDATETPVHFEFFAFGVIKDEEIGLSSNLVSFLFSQQIED